MTNRAFVLETMKRSGKLAAQALQSRSSEMTGTELNAEIAYIPDFKAACAKLNMLDRQVGFVCKTSTGRVVRLLQPYDSTIHTQEPEEFSDPWVFLWSTDPANALPFVAIANSPYNTGDCCSDGGVVYRSNVDGNTLSPAARADAWSVCTGGVEQ